MVRANADDWWRTRHAGRLDKANGASVWRRAHEHVSQPCRPMSALLELDVQLHYGGPRVVVANLHVNGEIACLLGPSGCSKTTVLRAIAGFSNISAGCIVFDGEAVSTPEHTVAPERRPLSMVFQDHALFPRLASPET